ncbi:MAG: alpha/beta hydrolase [Myxococcales bacterium]|nr:alpha/beta hydrolase [Myxococcales bacterium]
MDGPEAVAPKPKPPPTVVETCTLPDVPPEDDPDLEIDLDVVYASPKGQPQHLDIARPKTKGPHPLVVFVHGGGWTSGSRKLFRKEIRRLASIGYVAASIDYRLANKPQNVFPAGIADVRCALKFLRSEAKTYRLDPAHVAVIGASAGGHLAAMIGAQADDATLDGPCPVQGDAHVQAVVSYYGIYDLRTPKKSFTGKMPLAVQEFLGVEAESAPALGVKVSPLLHVSKAMPPTLLLHGVEDTIIPVAQARAMKTALGAAGVPSLLVEVDGKQGGHGFPLLVTTRPRVTCTTLAFLALELR